MYLLIENFHQTFREIKVRTQKNIIKEIPVANAAPVPPHIGIKIKLHTIFTIHAAAETTIL